MRVAEGPDTTAPPKPKSGFALANSSQRPAAQARAESLMVGKHRDDKENVAAGPGARLNGKILGDFSWALALAGRGDYGRWIGLWKCLRLEEPGCRPRVRSWKHRLGRRRLLSETAAIALVLALAVQLTVGSSLVELSGMPTAPP